MQLNLPLLYSSVNDVLVESTPFMYKMMLQVVNTANSGSVDVLLEHTPHLSLPG